MISSGGNQVIGVGTITNLVTLKLNGIIFSLLENKKVILYNKYINLLSIIEISNNLFIASGILYENGIHKLYFISFNKDISLINDLSDFVCTTLIFFMTKKIREYISVTSILCNNKNLLIFSFMNSNSIQNLHFIQSDNSKIIESFAQYSEESFLNIGRQSLDSSYPPNSESHLLIEKMGIAPQCPRYFIFDLSTFNCIESFEDNINSKLYKCEKYFDNICVSCIPFDNANCWKDPFRIQKICGTATNVFVIQETIKFNSKLKSISLKFSEIVQYQKLKIILIGMSVSNPIQMEIPYSNYTLNDQYLIINGLQLNSLSNFNPDKINVSLKDLHISNLLGNPLENDSLIISLDVSSSSTLDSFASSISSFFQNSQYFNKEIQ